MFVTNSNHWNRTKPTSRSFFYNSRTNRSNSQTSSSRTSRWSLTGTASQSNRRSFHQWTASLSRTQWTRLRATPTQWVSTLRWSSLSKWASVQSKRLKEWRETPTNIKRRREMDSGWPNHPRLRAIEEWARWTGSTFLILAMLCSWEDRISRWGILAGMRSVSQIFLRKILTRVLILREMQMRCQS